MTIVHVVRTLEYGGLERVALDLALAQQDAGDRVVIYSVYKQEESGLLPEAESARVRVVQFNKMTGFSISMLRRIALQLRRDRASVVHTHNELVHTYGTIAGRLAGVPCIVNTIHGNKSKTDPHPNRIYRSLLPWTDAVVAVSGETATQFVAERARYQNTFHIIHNAISVARFVAQSAHPGSQWPRIRIGTVARLVEVKDQATLIGAFRIVRDRFPHAELHLLGDGPLRANLEALSKQLELTGRVIFHGASSNVAEFLSGLDLFALSSISEGLPLAVLEAMSAGLPIVSTRVGGISEAAREHEAAEYCPPGDPEALARAIQSILTPEHLKVMGQSAQEFAQRSFTIEVMARDYDALYRSLLSKRLSYLSSLMPRLS